MSLLSTTAKRLLPEQAIRHWYARRATSYLATVPAPPRNGRKTILILNHFFDQDIKAICNANTEYNLVVLDATVLFRGAHRYFDLPVIELTAPYPAPESREATIYRRWCKSLWQEIAARFAPDLMLIVNDNFYWVRELIRVASATGVATVIADKEGTITPHFFEHHAARIRAFAPFMSDHVFVWSARQGEYWQRMGAGANDFTVVGQPRSDLFHQPIAATVDEFFEKAQPLVTLFSYDDTAYIPYEVLQESPIDWQPMKQETHDLFAALSAEYPQFNFVIKTHPQQLDRESMAVRYESSNLRVLHGASIANELIVRSELIVAFQTTAVLEAMSLGKRVIYTAWSAHLDSLREHLLPFEEASGMVVARNREQYRDTIRALLNGDDRPFRFSASEVTAREALVAQYLYKCDGRASHRLLEECGKFIR